MIFAFKEQWTENNLKYLLGMSEKKLSWENAEIFTSFIYEHVLIQSEACNYFLTTD